MIFHIVRYKSRHLSVTQDSILRYLSLRRGPNGEIGWQKKATTHHPGHDPGVHQSKWDHLYGWSQEEMEKSEGGNQPQSAHSLSDDNWDQVGSKVRQFSVHGSEGSPEKTGRSSGSDRCISTPPFSWSFSRKEMTKRNQEMVRPQLRLGFFITNYNKSEMEFIWQLTWKI